MAKQIVYDRRRHRPLLVSLQPPTSPQHGLIQTTQPLAFYHEGSTPLPSGQRAIRPVDGRWVARENQVIIEKVYNQGFGVDVAFKLIRRPKS